MVYLEYLDMKSKGMEQPKESDGNVALYANSSKRVMARSKTTRSSRAIATTVESRAHIGRL